MLDNSEVSATQYLDDSGSHDQSPVVVIGGPVILQSARFALEFEWDRLLRKHRVESPIHMKEFARPHGRLAHLNDAARAPLFEDLVNLIERSKLYSLSVRIEGASFRASFPPDAFKGLFGPTPYAFLWCLMLNSILLRDKPVGAPLAYVIAESNGKAQYLDCHSAWRIAEAKQQAARNTAGIEFSRPKDLGALQAADMIAWSNRRLAARDSFRGFEPLRRLTEARDVKRKTLHLHFEVDKDRAEELAHSFTQGEPLRRIGKLDLARWVSEYAAGASL